ncbi:extracellular solute-binding protein [Acaryochloris marina NIES-2412]|uniref:extracellular solute-binding protein n=1 Tax=Acaryochloris marina TaxID=155978 RepID=UPI004059E6BB
MLNNFLNSSTPLITYVGAFLILSFAALRFLDKSNVLRSDVWSTLFSAFIAVALILNPRKIEPWLSFSIVLLAIGVMSWMMLQKGLNKNDQCSLRVILASVVFVNILLFWNYSQHDLYGVKITAMLHEEIPNDSGQISHKSLLAESWEKDVIAAFKEKEGVTVDIKGVKPDVSERLIQFENILSDEKAPESVDVFAIDVIWPKLLAEHAEDLTPYFKNDLSRFIPSVIENNTIDKKLVAAPWYVDLGLLFYRKDLLNKYNEIPPKTWNELERVALKIQDSERKKGNKNFWGFIWQGKADEGLTCNALEWQSSHGGGILINSNGEIDFNESTISAFDRAKKWINNITLPMVLTYGQRDILGVWERKKAVFMRHWPYAYHASIRDGESSLLKKSDIGVTWLPSEDDKVSRQTATLGGWQLMVNNHSKGKKKKAAIKFVEFLSKDTNTKIPDLDSHSAPLSLVTKTGKLPALIDLYDDIDTKKSLPFVAGLHLKKLLSESSTQNPKIEIVKRPSTVTGRQYSAISKVYSNTVHEILKNQNSNTEKEVTELKNKLLRLLN